MTRTFPLVTLLALLTPAASAAVPASSAAVPSTDAVTEAIDLAEGALPIVRAPRPDAEPVITTDQRPQQLGSKILFVNFDGAQMNSCGNNDPHDNCSYIFGGTVLPYSGDAANRAAVIQVARKRVEDFGITVTDVRPGSGDYDMEMVGNWSGSSPDFAGIAPAGDCWDNYGGETSFTLEVSTSADAIAEVMMQELAHTWGLDHVDEQQDLLYPTTQGTNKTYRDECYQVVADTELNPTSGDCSHHQEACGTYSQQNSHAELLLIFGPSIADTAAPAVQILAPADGATIQGGDFELLIGLQDDQLPAVINMTITIDGTALPEPIESDGAFASPAELSFPIVGLPDGEYTIHLAGQDESDNPAEDQVSIVIEGSEVMPSTDDGADDSGGDVGDGTDAGDDGSGDGGDDEDDDGSASVDGGGTDGGQTGAPADDDTKGCACASTTGTPRGLAIASLLLVLGLRRRRAVVA